MKVRDKYDVPVSPLLHLYTIVHFALSFIVADFISESVKVLISIKPKLWVIMTNSRPHHKALSW